MAVGGFYMMILGDFFLRAGKSVLTAKILRKLMDQELLQKRLSVQSLLPIPVTYEQSEQQTGCRTAEMG